MKESDIKAIESIVGQENIAIGQEELSCYSFDATGRECLPQAVAFPGSTREVSSIMQLASRGRFPVVPRGAGTGMTGGALPVEGCLVLSTARLNRILEIDRVNMVSVVEPGVLTGDLQEACEQKGLFYPPDPASSSFCTIGGNAAECAGGPRGVKYGVTRDYILGLQAVLPGGEIIHTGVRTRKGVAGYDLTRLLVGSEGTLAVLTQLILRLVPKPETRQTFLLCCRDLRQGTELVSEIFAAGILPCTLEYMDRTAVRLVIEQLTFTLPPDTGSLLLIEFDGTADETTRDGRRLNEFVASKTGITLLQAQSTAMAAELWSARKSISPAAFALRPHKVSEDVVVPCSKIPELTDFTEKIGRELDILIFTFGHAGDGNIHVNIMLDKTDREDVDRCEIIRRKLFERVIELDGTLSGEHGIGVTKSSFMPLEIDQSTLSIMRSIKRTFDPLNILNPGKAFPPE